MDLYGKDNPIEPPSTTARRFELAHIGGAPTNFDHSADVGPPKLVGEQERIVSRLSICLPSRHLGGEVHAIYGGRTTTTSTAAHSAFGHSYAAWHTGVTYDIEPVHSGYRLTLEYNLVSNSADDVKFPDDSNWRKRELREPLAAYINNVKKERASRKSAYPTLLAFVCDTDIDSSHPGFSVLRGTDRLRVDFLKDICGQIGISLYVAYIKPIHTGYCTWGPTHKDEEEPWELKVDEDDSISLTKLVDVDGNTVAEDIAIEYINVVQESPFDYAFIEDKYDQAIDNMTHIYRAMALVLVLNVCRSDWLPEERLESANKRKRGTGITDLE